MRKCRTVSGLEDAIKKGEPACLEYDEITEGAWSNYKLIIGDNEETITPEQFYRLKPYLVHKAWVLVATNNKKFSLHKGVKRYASVKSGSTKFKPVEKLEDAIEFASVAQAENFVRRYFNTEVGAKTGDILFAVEKVNFIKSPVMSYTESGA